MWPFLRLASDFYLQWMNKRRPILLYSFKQNVYKALWLIGLFKITAVLFVPVTIFNFIRLFRKGFSISEHSSIKNVEFLERFSKPTANVSNKNLHNLITNILNQSFPLWRSKGNHLFSRHVCEALPSTTFFRFFFLDFQQSGEHTNHSSSLPRHRHV